MSSRPQINQRRTPHPPQMLRQFWIVQVRVPAHSRRRFPGSQKHQQLQLGRFQRGDFQCDWPKRIKKQHPPKFIQIVDEPLRHRSVRQVQPRRIRHHQFAHQLRPQNRQFHSQPAAERKSHHRHIAQIELLEKIDVVPGQILNVVDLIQPFRKRKPRMRRRDHRKTPRQPVVKRRPLHLAAGAVQIHQRRPLPAAHHLRLLPGNGDEISRILNLRHDECH